LNIIYLKNSYLMIYKISFLFVFLSIVVKFIAINTTNFDLFGDEAQYWLWSENLALGYYSKPPLLPWYISVFTYIFGNSFEVLKTIPILTYFLISYTVYLLSYQLYKDKEIAFLAGISFYLLPSVSVSSFLLSTDIILILFWSLSLLFLLKLREEGSLKNFILLAIFLGLSFLAKYAAIYFLISLLFFVLVDKKIRNIFKNNFLYLCMFFLITFVILLPNIVWNTKNEWSTLNHTAENAGLSRIGFNLLQGFEFLAMQALMIGPILFVSFFFIIKKIKLNFETKFLLAFSIPIIVIVLVESIIVRANANWAAVALIALFLLIFKNIYVFSKNIITISNFFNFLFVFVFFIIISLTYPLKVFDRINGIKSFTNIVEKNYLKENKYLIVEDRLLYSNIRYILRNTEKTILMPYEPFSKIKNHFNITDPLLSDFNKDFIYIGDLENIKYLTRKNKKIKIAGHRESFKNNTINIYEVLF